MTPQGPHVLITGGSRGIGLAYAEALLELGCDVVLNHYGDAAKAEAECARLRGISGRNVFAIEADVGNTEQARAMVDEAADRLGGLDIVVSNAGICRFTPFVDLTDEDWRRHVAVNFDAAFYVGQQAARRMIKQGRGGRIIFTTSIGARRSNATQVHYCATKGGLHLLMQGMALELGPHGITVNGIAPGWIHTNINDAASRDPVSVPAWIRSNCAVGRLGRPEDLKAAIQLLASREAAYMNGASIDVDGGWNAQL